jgi:signal transduction histidine kinase
VVSWWGSLRSTTRDTILGVFFSFGWFFAYGYFESRAWHPAEPSTWHLAGAWTGLAFIFRRRFPRTLLVATAIVYPLLYGVGLQTEFHLIPVLVVAYSGTLLPGNPWWLAIPAPFLSAYALDNPLFFPYPPDTSETLFHLTAVAVAVLMGLLVRRHQETARTLAAQNMELERLRAVEAQRAVSEERARIARELHDVVAHHLVSLIVRGQAAERVAVRDPEAVREAVPWMVGVAREALTSIRQTVGMLRSDAPDLSELQAIADRVRETGLAVEFDAPDELPDLPEPVRHAAVRIVQEALTNTLRHSGASRAWVSVRPGADGLGVVVEDDGRFREVVPGNGIRGMEERAAACGGTLSLSRGTGGGLRVSAWLPVSQKVAVP